MYFETDAESPDLILQSGEGPLGPVFGQTNTVKIAQLPNLENKNYSGSKALSIF